MNWTHFLLWVAGLYALYYLAIVLIDLAGGSRIPAEHHTTQELTFSESVAPTQLQHEPVAESKVAPGKTVRVTISKTINRDAARKTIQRLFLKDKAITGPIALRSRNFKEQIAPAVTGSATKRTDASHTAIPQTAIPMSAQ